MQFHIIFHAEAEHEHEHDGDGEMGEEMEFDEPIPEEDEEDVAYVPTKAQTEPQKASDLYLDTVRTYCPEITLQVL